MRQLWLSPPAPAISEVARFAGESGRNLVAIDLCSAFLPQGVALFVSDAADENLDEGVIAAHAVDARSARLLQQPSMATRSLLNGGEVWRQLLHHLNGRCCPPRPPTPPAAH